MDGGKLEVNRPNVALELLQRPRANDRYSAMASCPRDSNLIRAGSQFVGNCEDSVEDLGTLLTVFGLTYAAAKPFGAVYFTDRFLKSGGACCLDESRALRPFVILLRSPAPEFR